MCIVTCFFQSLGNKSKPNKNTSSIVECVSRRTDNLYGYQFRNSYAHIFSTSIYESPAKNQVLRLPHVYDDYRPIYFYVAQQYTIPYKSTQGLKQSLHKSGNQRDYCRVTFLRSLSSTEFSPQFSHDDFLQKLNQVQLSNKAIEGKSNLNHSFIQYQFELDSIAEVFFLPSDFIQNKFFDNNLKI